MKQMTTLYKAEIPFALLLLPFLAGLGLVAAYPLTAYTLLLQIGFGLMLSAFVILNIAYQKLNLHKIKWLGGAIVSLLLFLGGMICFESNREINSEQHFSKHSSAYLIGRINTEPKLSSGILRFTIRVEQAGNTAKLQTTTGNLMVAVKVDTGNKRLLMYGDRIAIPGKVTPIEPPMNPAEFNYKAYLAHQNIYQQTFLLQGQVKLLAHDKGNPIIAAALNLRLSLVNKLKAHISDTDAVAVASTIILGYRADLRKEVQQTYANTGTMHLLSVAGMHVGLVYLMLAFILSFLPHRKHTKIIKAIISIALIWCYALITGFAPAVSRAALMLTFVIIGSCFNRHINRLNLLAVSAFVLLLYNPFYILDAGFQLSYLAVFGIVIIQPYIFKWFDFKSRLAREVWLVASVSIAAQVILFPIGALYFHDFPVYFLISNIFIIIPSAIVMYGGIIYLALPNMPTVSSGLGWVLQKTIIIMTKTLTGIAYAPMASVNKIWLSPVEFILAYAIIAGMFCSLALRNKQWLKFSLLACLLMTLCCSIKAYRTSQSKTIIFFSLRKNNAILFKNGNSGILLTDLKTTDKAYQYSIQPGLDSCHITNLKQMSLTGDISTPVITKQGALIQFYGRTVLILDTTNAAKKLKDRLSVDCIYACNNPKTNLQYLKQSFNFKLLVASGTNSTRLLNQLQQDALKTNLSFVDLKRNKWLLLVSN
jgi:competence protein ComEC